MFACVQFHTNFYFSGSRLGEEWIVGLETKNSKFVYSTYYTMLESFALFQSKTVNK